MLEVGLEAWKDPTMLSYNCFHLDIHEGAQTQWMMEFMAGPGREIGERTNIHHAVAGDIFMVNARLPRTNAQIRFPREERDVVQVDHTANEKNDRFHIPRH